MTITRSVETEAWWRRPKVSREEEHMIAMGRALPPKGPNVTLWFDRPLVEWPERGCRFAVVATGRVVTGDPATVLHVDMVKGSGSIGEGEPLLAGCVMPYRRAWTMYAVQNFVNRVDPKAAEILCSNLVSWASFIGEEKVWWPEPGEFGSELYERIDRENPDKV